MSNLHQEAKAVSLFEIGHVFEPSRGQKLTCGVALAGSAHEKTWNQPERPFDFFDLKGIFEQLVADLGVSRSAKWKALEIDPWDHGTALALYVNNQPMATIGAVTEALEGYRAWYGQIDLESLESSIQPVVRYAPLPKFPAINRDVAFTVQGDRTVGELMGAIREEAGPWLERVELFDVYRGAPLPADQKNVAFKLVFRSGQETLRHEQIHSLMEKLVARLSERCGAKLRTDS